jgi:hypothetical protein
VSEIMKTDIVSVKPETDTFEASNIMAENKVRRLPVLEDGKLAGIVSTSDLATYLEKEVDSSRRRGLSPLKPKRYRKINKKGPGQAAGIFLLLFYFSKSVFLVGFYRSSFGGIISKEKNSIVN